MLHTFDVWHAVKTRNSAIVFERSGVRNCNCLSDHLALKLMEEGAASV